jgi:uncharacterized protein YutE (UPF0331/DUF86 family)
MPGNGSIGSQEGALVDREVFDRRLARLEQVLRQLRGIGAVERDRFLQDAALQAQVERWLYVAAECCLDLAHHLISDRGWRTPATYREAFATLEQEGVLAPDLATAMQGWAGLRNVLAHMYLDVDYGLLHTIMTRDLQQLEAFALAVTRAVRGA